MNRRVVWALAFSTFLAACASGDPSPAAGGTGGSRPGATGGASGMPGAGGGSAAAGGLAGSTSGAGGAAGAASGAGGIDAREPAPGTGGAPAIPGTGGVIATGGTAGSDAAPNGDSTPGACVTMGTELCEDFESGKLDTQRWRINKPTGSASIAVDGTRVHGGKFAVHIKVVPNQQSTAMITESVTFPGTKNAFYARMFINFGPEIPTAPSADFHTGFLLGVGRNDRGDVQAGLGMIGSAKQWLGYSIFFGNPKLEFGPWSKTLIAANQWQCVELFEDGSNPATEVRQIWVDDIELMDLRSDSAKAANGQVNHLPPKFDGVSFGLVEYHPIPTLSDVWIDDIRVSSQRIGCD